MAAPVAMSRVRAYVAGMITPRELMDLALARHRQPWNMTLQLGGCALLALALLLHGALVASMGLVLVGVGFMNLRLAPMRPGRWHTFLDRVLAAEVGWLNAPMGWRKLLRTAVLLGIVSVTFWALWMRDIAVLGMLVCMWAVYLAYRYNRTTGIDP
ncbi:hypothetical protein [Pseudodesulfovibrio senegalensis]|jgi:hypothetical protein|uniref:Uncharacterized protein n=1 Tax=Pseudodesulfovibrio senegalensis TaxID=1721087 RepID=A0A6N6N3P5_9BACT|nr:hypothetical protein [Pseudodesulfovibrio senegalensis]KAB1441703.1 hypothetical protein F8A88_08890 [Pseudodesulfovibrio senegalensis]